MTFRINLFGIPHLRQSECRFADIPRACTSPLFFLLPALILLFGFAEPVLRAQSPDPAIDAQFQSDLRAIATAGPTEFPSRVIGSPGYEATADYLRRQIRSLPNVELREQTFSVMMPVTRRADLTFDDGGTERIYPFWPASVRVNSTPEPGIQGDLVYIGQGQLEQIQPALLRGQIAVMEASGKKAWQNAFYFGARALLILGSVDVTNDDLMTHDLLIPVNFPRFYVPPGNLADKLRHQPPVTSAPLRATLHADVQWQRKTAHNLLALVRSPVLEGINKLPLPAQWALGRVATPAPSGWSAASPPAALMISVPFEASGLVPDLAVGASQAVQTASGLELLRDLSRQPRERPVVVFFGGADSVQMLATRNMFMALSDVPARSRQLLTQGPNSLDKLESDLRRDLARADQVLDDPRALDVVKDRPLIDRITRIIETDAALDLDELFRLRRKSDAQKLPADRTRQQNLEAAQVRDNSLRFAIQRQPATLSSTRNPSDPEAPAPLEEARRYIQRTILRMRGSPDGGVEGLLQQYSERRRLLQERIDLYHWLANALHRDAEPDVHSNDSRLLEMLVALDFSDHGMRAGPLYWGQFQRTSAISSLQDYRDWFAKAGVGVIADQKGLVDVDPLSGAQSPQSYLCASMAIGSEVAQDFGVPGFTWLTLDDLRLRRDTPSDTLDHLNTAAILPQLRAARDVLWKAWDDPRFKGPVELKWSRERLRGQVVSPASGRPVPNLPRPGFFATYFYSNNGKIPHIYPIPYMIGTRRCELQPCDAEGNYAFEGLPMPPGTTTGGIDIHKLLVEVFRFDTDGSINACSDQAQQVDQMTVYSTLHEDPASLRSLVFNCAEFSLVGLYDPRYLQDLMELDILDARRNANPQQWNVLIRSQLMAGFVEPGQRTYLTFRYGRVGNRLILVNEQSPESVSGVKSAQDAVRIASPGFTIPELRAISPLAHVTSNDFFNIDQMRLERYRRAGVESNMIDELHQRTRTELRAADSGFDLPSLMRGIPLLQFSTLDDALRTDAAAYTRQVNGAWANEARVYQATQDMANDVIHAAIFLLLLCIPFSFCMERLLIASAGIYRQIAGMAVIFGLMTAMLWSFHPAFKISASPLIIILAFGIILMSLIVIAVVYGKFDTELKRIRSGRATAAAASLARASVLMSAVLLGIANMRRRKFRTALTSITIILITFAVLCFTSASRYLDVTEIPSGVPSGHHGIMVRQRGFRQLPPDSVDNLRAVVGKRNLVERWWNLNPADPKDVLHVTADPFSQRPASTLPSRSAPPSAIPVLAALGLSPGESALSAIRQVIGQDSAGHWKFDRLEAGEFNIVYFSREMAQRLGVNEHDHVRVGGIDLEIAGIFDASIFDQRVTTLEGAPLAPLKYASGALDAGGRRLDETSLESLDLDVEGSEAEAASNYEHLSSTDFIIVPSAVSRILPNAALRSVGFLLDDDAQVKAMAAALSQRFSVALFAGEDDGVKLVSSASGLPRVSGASAVAIPLAIAGLIIFNTMMGSIAERRREIHIYTSLGLAPLHVGALFLAEALTYGLIGAVFGYIGGQLTGFLLLKFGWLGGVTLNYSGTSAMFTMGLILVIVLLSALVPARLASKIAAPSIERSWKVPLPKGDEILAHLPFTINKTAADGALAYLAEYFDAHQEGSIGKFSTGKIEAFSFPDEAGVDSRGLKTTVWLTPFDLGVRQHFMLLIHPGQFKDIYEVQVSLQRLSGDNGSWYRMNRPFLTELRKQFLQWRSLSPQRMLEYVEASRNLFDATPTQHS